MVIIIGLTPVWIWHKSLTMDCVHTWLAYLDLHVGEHEWSLPISSSLPTTVHIRRLAIMDVHVTWWIDASSWLALHVDDEKQQRQCAVQQIKWIDRSDPGRHGNMHMCMAHACTQEQGYSRLLCDRRTHAVQWFHRGTMAGDALLFAMGHASSCF